MVMAVSEMPLAIVLRVHCSLPQPRRQIEVMGDMIAEPIRSTVPAASNVSNFVRMPPIDDQTCSFKVDGDIARLSTPSPSPSALKHATEFWSSISNCSNTKSWYQLSSPGDEGGDGDGDGDG